MISSIESGFPVLFSGSQRQRSGSAFEETVPFVWYAESPAVRTCGINVLSVDDATGKIEPVDFAGDDFLI